MNDKHEDGRLNEQNGLTETSKHTHKHEAEAEAEAESERTDEGWPRAAFH